MFFSPAANPPIPYPALHLTTHGEWGGKWVRRNESLHISSEVLWTKESADSWDYTHTHTHKQTYINRHTQNSRTHRRNWPCYARQKLQFGFPIFSKNRSLLVGEKGAWVLIQIRWSFTPIHWLTQGRQIKPLGMEMDLNGRGWSARKSKPLRANR